MGWAAHTFSSPDSIEYPGALQLFEKLGTDAREQKDAANRLDFGTVAFDYAEERTADVGAATQPQNHGRAVPIRPPWAEAR